MFRSIVAALDKIAAAITAQNTLIEETNVQLKRIADEMAVPQAVGIEVTHSTPEPRT